MWFKTRPAHLREQVCWTSRLVKVSASSGRECTKVKRVFSLWQSTCSFTSVREHWNKGAVEQSLAKGAWGLWCCDKILIRRRPLLAANIPFTGCFYFHQELEEMLILCFFFRPLSCAQSTSPPRTFIRNPARENSRIWNQSSLSSDPSPVCTLRVPNYLNQVAVLALGGKIWSGRIAGTS